MMLKLTHAAFGVLKSKLPLNPNFTWGLILDFGNNIYTLKKFFVALVENKA